MKPTAIQIKARSIQLRIEQRIDQGETFLGASFPVFVLALSSTETIAIASPLFGVGANADQALEALARSLEADGSHAEGLPTAHIKIATRMEKEEQP